jgi:hypothetical protein
MFNLQVMDGQQSAMVVKESKMGTSVAFCSKKEFKLRHPEMSCSELKKAYNALIRNNGDKLRAALSSHMHEQKFIPKSVRSFKNGNLNVSLLHPKNLKDAVPKGKKTVTADEAKSSLTKFTKADLATIQAEIAKLMAQ